MHWAAHKHTAAEVIYQRADADKDNMGLAAWAGKEIKRSDVEVAKNYLNEKYRKMQEDILSPVECHFLESIEELQELEDKK